MDPISLSLWLGISVHPVKIDEPEISGFDNPIGTVRAEISTDDKYKFYVQHKSSIKASESGYGFNEIGIEYRLW